MNSKKKTNIIDYLKKKNFKRFSLFFLVAFVFLIFSKLSNDYKQTIRLKVKLIHVDDEILIKKDSSNSIEAYVEAKGFSLMPFIFDNTKALIVDAKTDVTVRADYFVFDVTKHKYLIERQFGDAYHLISVIPDTLAIAYSKRASKKLPITFKKEIAYSVGYDLKGGFALEMDSAKVVGPVEEISKMKTITTETLKLNEVKTDINSSVGLDISAFKNVEVFPKTINVKGKVARFTEGVIEVPITIINQPEDVVINYFPKTVTLSYYVDLDQYNHIKASDFKVACDYLDREENQRFLVPKVVQSSEFVKYVNIKQKQIDFIEL